MLGVGMGIGKGMGDGKHIITHHIHPTRLLVPKSHVPPYPHTPHTARHTLLTPHNAHHTQPTAHRPPHTTHHLLQLPNKLAADPCAGAIDCGWPILC